MKRSMGTWQDLFFVSVWVMRNAGEKTSTKITFCARIDDWERRRPESKFGDEYNNQPLTTVQYDYWSNVDALDWVIGSSHLVFWRIHLEALLSNCQMQCWFLSMKKTTQCANSEFKLGNLVNKCLDIGYIFLPLPGKLCGFRLSGAGGRPSRETIVPSKKRRLTYVS